jgi:hypothetical protein
LTKSFTAAAIGLAVLCACSPAAAAENELDFWLNPSVSKDIDKQSFVEVETQQRFFGDDTKDFYVGRLWYGRKLGSGVTAMVGVHRGWQGDVRENRLMQQVSYPLTNVLKGRTRLEQRFFNNDPRTAWRLRQRVGLSVPLSEVKDGWEFASNVEGFFTLRAARAGGQTGLTAVRAFAGVEREFDRFELSLGYTRQQTVRRGAPDRVGHAPTIAVNFKL